MARGHQDKAYLRKLLRKAEEHCDGDDYDQVSDLYRNKPSSYFKNIRRHHGDIMVPYVKDDGGDPRCPINGRLYGLFFGVTLYRGDLPDMSPFGNTRVIVPLDELFDDTANLYFADFYCKPSRKHIHYVTLVLTDARSDADRFCRRHLIKLDPYNNNYLLKDKFSDTYMTLDQSEVQVEVMYTENIDMSHRHLTSTPTIGQGHSTPGGISKSENCDICNVW